jgi:hypothetical protein
MIALLDTNYDLDRAASEIGCPCERLIVPGARPQTTQRERPFAIDSGAYTGFNRSLFLALLDRERERKQRCIFVAVPDVVGSARRTLEAFDYWAGRLSSWPLAYVAQDGQEDIPVPWDRVAAVFIGGSTEWKMSKHAAHVIRAAQLMGKWTHAGRVNTPGRFEHFEALGVDSIDGSGLARYTWMREAIHAQETAPNLFDAAA